MPRLHEMDLWDYINRLGIHIPVRYLMATDQHPRGSWYYEAEPGRWVSDRTLKRRHTWLLDQVGPLLDPRNIAWTALWRRIQTPYGRDTILHSWRLRLIDPAFQRPEPEDLPDVGRNAPRDRVSRAGPKQAGKSGRRA